MFVGAISRMSDGQNEEDCPMLVCINMMREQRVCARLTDS